MEKLPTEVFCNILRLIHPDDHTECMLVCRKWRQIMEQFILFRTVCLRDRNDLADLLKKIERNPVIANKIEQLALVADREFERLKEEEILRLLPNLKMLHCESNIDQFYSKDQTDYSWHNCIQHITGFGCSKLVAQRLSQVSYPKLTTLQIGNTKKNIIPFLKNAPALRHLILSEHNTLTYQDLDEMHRNLPLLKILDLKFENIDNDSKLDYEIEPAYSLTDFTFGQHKLLGDAPHTNILKYVIKKYPNLSRLKCKMGPSSISKNHQGSFNESELIPLIQKLGPQLKAISLFNSGKLTNFSDLLDQHSCQVEFLELYPLPCNVIQKISQGIQALFIQTLVLGNYNLKSFDWLKQFQVLKKMTIWADMSLMMDELVSKCPQSLKSLSLFDITIKANRGYIGPSSNIERLSFGWSIISVGVDIFINSHMPRLSKLEFDHCKFIKDSFHLPEINMSSFHFIHSCFATAYYISVSTLSDNKKVWYFHQEYMDNRKRGDKFLETFYYTRYSRFTTEAKTKANRRRFLNLVCKSLKNAYIT